MCFNVMIAGVCFALKWEGYFRDERGSWSTNRPEVYLALSEGQGEFIGLISHIIIYLICMF